MTIKFVARSGKSMGGTTFYQQIVRAMAEGVTTLHVYVGEGKYGHRILAAYDAALSDVRKLTDKQFSLHVEFVADVQYNWLKSKGY